ncbi:hypothetical protein [Spirochaeta lutea]|uniref:UVR domain-containing protein n=1 Tax=Spirochaeta lutea TaxID=1480694 RepID=A0A098QT44_9SPIO|nr:hypothetical protein [Spirochaeta lutea]KGE70736.1 hypothetical protein DC28_14640 [Spirochaeta lutea]
MNQEHENRSRVCEHCQAAPAVRIIHIVEGTARREIHLCEACSIRAGAVPEDSAVIPRVGDLFGDLLNPEEEQDLDRQCPGCGTTLLHLRATGLAGCQGCYHEFGPLIQRLIHGVDRGSVHRGAYPARLQMVLDIFRAHDLPGDDHDSP